MDLPFIYFMPPKNVFLLVMEQSDCELCINLLNLRNINNHLKIPIFALLFVGCIPQHCYFWLNIY